VPPETPTWPVDPAAEPPEIPPEYPLKPPDVDPEASGCEPPLFTVPFEVPAPFEVTPLFEMGALPLLPAKHGTAPQAPRPSARASATGVIRRIRRVLVVFMVFIPLWDLFLAWAVLPGLLRRCARCLADVDAESVMLPPDSCSRSR